MRNQTALVCNWRLLNLRLRRVLSFGLAICSVFFGSPSLLASEIDSTVKAAELASARWGSQRLLLFGELHGTVEAPTLVGHFIQAAARHHKALILAIEFPRSSQQAIDRFVSSHGSSIDLQVLLGDAVWHGTDGRTSSALLGLVRTVQRLSAAKAQIQVFCFDVDMSYIGSRDKGMADNLRPLIDSNPNAQIVVLTGNYHSRLRQPPSDAPTSSYLVLRQPGSSLSENAPMGTYLVDEQPVSLKISAGSGAAWNCQPDCGEHAVRSRYTTKAASIVEDIDVIGEGYTAEIRLPAFHASPPALRGN